MTKTTCSQNIRPALLTLSAIDKAIERDQGAAYRLNLKKILPTINDAYRGEDDPFRPHLGASIIGKECPRAIWYDFRWFSKPEFSGRLLRLFNRGHLEEGRVIAALTTAGIEVIQQDEKGKQYNMSYAEGHFGGSGDGLARNVPDLAPNTVCLLEFKTHNTKSFTSVSQFGVQEEKPEHYVQMQVLMRGMGLPVALYIAVQKETDDIHAELVTVKSEVGDMYLARAVKIILAEQPPPKLNKNQAYYKCRWCSHHAVCHKNGAPATNCRTCVHSQPMQEKVWYCNQHRQQISLTQQLTGCGHHKAR